MKQNAPAQASIAERAYSLWEQAGRPAGHDEEFWLRAEAELAPQASPAGVPPIIASPVATPPPVSIQSPLHQVPPPIKGAVQSPGRRPPRPRAPKRG